MAPHVYQKRLVVGDKLEIEGVAYEDDNVTPFDFGLYQGVGVVHAYVGAGAAIATLEVTLGVGTWSAVLSSSESAKLAGLGRAHVQVRAVAGIDRHTLAKVELLLEEMLA